MRQEPNRVVPPNNYCVRLNLAAFRPNARGNDRGTAMVVKDDNDEGSIECDGKDMFVVRGGVRLAKRKHNKWVSLIPGVTVQDIKEKGHRHEIEIIYSGTLH